MNNEDALIQTLAGPWAMAEEYMNQMGSWFRAARGGITPLPAATYRVDRGLSVVDINGTLYKSSLNLYGYTMRGTHDLATAVRAADADPGTTKILLNIDSPGGMVAGTDELARAVSETKKPTIAIVSDLCASAAYWVAAQADEIYANETAQVGSIGVYALLYDWSAAFNEAGIKAHVVRAGQFKGAGAMGTEITAEQIAEFQRSINDINAIFLQRVAQGRGPRIADVASVATGQAWIARDALSMGLIDGIANYENTVSRLVGAVPTGARADQPKEAQQMSELTNTPQAASYADLKAALPDAGADFIVAQMDAQATLAQAQGAYVKHLQAKAAEADAARVAAEAEAAKAKAEAEELKRAPKAVGVDAPLAQAGESTEGVNASEEFEAKVSALVTAGKPRNEAIKTVGTKHPDLRAAWVAEHNQKAKG